jgi:hypothetical protein
MTFTCAGEVSISIAVTQAENFETNREIRCDVVSKESRGNGNPSHAAEEDILV